MQHSEFQIGQNFVCGEKLWRCTDIGTRTVVAICLSQVVVGQSVLTQAEAEAKGWFNGPSYAVAELVFDENDLPACSLEGNDGTE